MEEKNDEIAGETLAKTYPGLKHRPTAFPTNDVIARVLPGYICKQYTGDFNSILYATNLPKSISRSKRTNSSICLQFPTNIRN